MSFQTAAMFLLPHALIALPGCGTRQDQPHVSESIPIWEIIHFDLDGDYQVVAKPTKPAKSIVIGRIETSETHLYPLDDDGNPLPHLTYREGQLVERDSGNSLPIQVDDRAGLFDVLADVNGQTVKLHLTQDPKGESFTIHHENVSAIERSH
jgi:hypothetical protein